jgi:hypothetical protein
VLLKEIKQIAARFSLKADGTTADIIWLVGFKASILTGQANSRPKPARKSGRPKSLRFRARRRPERLARAIRDPPREISGRFEPAFISCQAG